MLSVLGTQGALGLQLAQALVNLGVFEGVAPVDGRLVGIGARLPLAADLAVPLLELVQQGLGLLGRNRLADRFLDVFFEDGQREIVALEIDFRVGGGSGPVKAPFTDGFDFADAVLGVVY